MVNKQDCCQLLAMTGFLLGTTVVFLIIGALGMYVVCVYVHLYVELAKRSVMNIDIIGYCVCAELKVTSPLLYLLGRQTFTL